MSTGTTYRGRRRRKKRSNVPVIIAVIAGVLIIAGIIFGISKLIKKQSESTETEAEIELSNEVIVDGVNITGMKESEAREAILKKYPWEMTVKNPGADIKTFELQNYMLPSVNSVLDTVYTSINPNDSYTIIFEADEKMIAEDMEAMKAMWNKEARNGSVASYNTETKELTFTGAEEGLVIDEEKLLADIKNAIATKDYKKTIEVETVKVIPEISEEKAKELYKIIGTFTTKSTNNSDRNNNLNLACNAINGVILQPEEEFTFNLTTGMRSEEKGYKAAGAYQNGELVEETGGGVCQVASTLYNSVVFAGLEVTERHAHTFEPSYVTPGEDSTVSYDGYNGPDLKFKNNTISAIVILAHYESQTVTCSIYGIPVLPEGETRIMKSEKDPNYNPDIAPVIYEEDPTLPPHTEQEVQKGDQGSRWYTSIIRVVNGEEVEVLEKYTSTYKGHTPKIKRNQTDYQLNEAGETIASSFQETDEFGNVIPVTSEAETQATPVVETTAASSEQIPATTAATQPEEESPVPAEAAPGFENTETVAPHPGA